MSNPGGAQKPLKGTPEMVRFSVEDYQSRSDISDIYSLRQTTPDQSERESGNERSYFEEDAKRTCGVSSTTFWILLAVFLALVIGGIIGSVTAAVEINKHHHTTSSSSSSTSSSTITTPTATSMPTTSPSSTLQRRRSLPNHDPHQR